MASIQKAKASPLQTQRVYYSDFKTSFDFQKGDLITLTNDDSVRQSLRNIFLTNSGDRLFSAMDSGMRALLFEPISSVTEAIIENKVRLAIQNYEPRVKILDLRINGSEEDDAYLITLTVSIINTNESVSMDFILSRVR